MTVELVCPDCDCGETAEAMKENGIVQLVDDDKGFCPACGSEMTVDDQDKRRLADGEQCH